MFNVKNMNSLIKTYYNNKYPPQDYSSHFVIGLSIALIASILFIPLFIKSPLMKRRYIRNKIRKKFQMDNFYRLSKDSIGFEIIERFGIRNRAKIKQGVKELKKNGVKIVIDDLEWITPI